MNPAKFFNTAFFIRGILKLLLFFMFTRFLYLDFGINLQKDAPTNFVEFRICFYFRKVSTAKVNLTVQIL